MDLPLRSWTLIHRLALESEFLKSFRKNVHELFALNLRLTDAISFRWLLKLKLLGN